LRIEDEDSVSIIEKDRTLRAVRTEAEGKVELQA